MRQIFADVWLLIQLGRVRGLEARGDFGAALKRIESIRYSGPEAAVLKTYHVRLMALTGAGGALEYLGIVVDYIRSNASSLKYSEYCAAYCDYLECVFTKKPYDVAAGIVLSKPSTKFVRSTLLVT